MLRLDRTAVGEPYYTDFPRLTIRDIVAAHRLLADALGIGRIAVLVGSSVGGFQAIEWAVSEPERFDRLILIATDAKASPWAIAIDETQRMAIKADRSYGERRHDAARDGLAAARAIGLLSYRGPWGYNATQQDRSDTPPAAPSHTSAIRAKSSAAASTPTPTSRYSTPSTPTTSATAAAVSPRPCSASAPTPSS